MHSHLSDYVFSYVEDGWDPFETSVLLKYRNDFVWRFEDGWKIKLSANGIFKTDFGYFVDSTYLVEYYGPQNIFYDEAGDILPPYKGGTNFVDLNFKTIDLPVSKYYISYPMEGRSDLILVNYGSENRPELTAIIAVDGKIAVEACGYEIDGDLLKYSPCSEEGYGSPLFDNNGNQVFKEVKIK